MARRPPLTYRRSPRPGAPDGVGDLTPPLELVHATTVPPPTSAAFRVLRGQLRQLLDHGLRCRVCRRPPRARRCADGELLEYLRRDADRAYSRQRVPRTPAPGRFR